MIPLERLPDWEARLNEYLAGIDGQAHDWGTHDCALAWASGIEAMTGTDIAAAFRGKYASEAEATAAIKAAGHESLAGLVESMLPHKSRAMAQRGDIIMTRDGNLAMVYGDVALGVGEDLVRQRIGLVRIPRDQWVRAWGVGG